jgi:hypothetical protein
VLRARELALPLPPRTHFPRLGLWWPCPGTLLACCPSQHRQPTRARTPAAGKSGAPPWGSRLRHTQAITGISPRPPSGRRAPSHSATPCTGAQCGRCPDGGRPLPAVWARRDAPTSPAYLCVFFSVPGGRPRSGPLLRVAPAGAGRWQLCLDPRRAPRQASAWAPQKPGALCRWRQEGRASLRAPRPGGGLPLTTLPIVHMCDTSRPGTFSGVHGSHPRLGIAGACCVCPTLCVPRARRGCSQRLGIAVAAACSAARRAPSPCVGRLVVGHCRAALHGPTGCLVRNRRTAGLGIPHVLRLSLFGGWM